ncbi:ABC transporter ATP-binding protein [Desulfobacter latus]|uniref:ATP-binding cassette domain-containing protein n=1 Tax=Desulfobacter latus TaxID=2292 RepID=A0A850T9V9_9BACT|nr:ABC transporter ATP-binding protein [Desulfobacter latus]NWH04997.1 ATP-binding cassette domain-containing protein [Desulfobacter latus]
MTHHIPCFEFHDVSFSWQGERVILDRQSFTLPQGGFTLIQGPSGAGKSTLLRLMNRLEEVETGKISYLGQNLTDWNPSELRRQVAYLQQTPVIPDRSVREVLLQPFFFRINREKAKPSDPTLKQLLDKVQMNDVGLDDSGAMLSGGQRQRLSLVRTLLTGPNVLLLDEPTSSLDSDSRRCVLELVEELNRQGTTIVMITHDTFLPKHMPVMKITID